MRKLFYSTVATTFLAVALLAGTAIAQTLQNPSFENGMTGWSTYTYSYTGDQVVAETPQSKQQDVSGGFEVLTGNAPPQGDYICGYEAWGDAPQGGCYQTFTVPAGMNYVLISARAYSVQFDDPSVPYDWGDRVRAGVVPGTATDRAQVTEWFNCHWGNDYDWSNIAIPVTPGQQYTLFIENRVGGPYGIFTTCWDNVRFAADYVKLTSGPTATVTKTSVTIEWDTNISSTSEVDYDNDGYPYTHFPDPSHGNDPVYGPSGTHHVVTISGLTSGTMYHYAIKSDASGFDSVYQLGGVQDHYFITLTDAYQNLMNGDFEAVDGGGNHTIAPWNQYDEFDGLIEGEWFNSMMPHGGGYFAGAAASYGTKNGGLFQRVMVTPGTWYRAETWIQTWTQNDSVPQWWENRCRIGLDPNGGVDPNASSVQWSTAQSTESTVAPFDELGWKKIGTAAQAGTGGVVTIFLKVEQDWAIDWNVTGLDDVTLTAASASDPINYNNHIGKAKVYLGEGYPVSFTGKLAATVYSNTVTRMNPPVRNYVYIQEEDRSSGIKMDVTNFDSVPLGSKITVSGNLQTASGETQLSLKSLTVASPAPEPLALPKPLVITGKLVGSGSLGVQPALSGSAGLTTVGLRVRIAGQITGTGATPTQDAMVSYIDDGSGVLNDSLAMLGGTSCAGVKVVYPAGGTILYPTYYGAVTGTAGLDYDDFVGLIPVIHVNAVDGDIQQY